MSESNHTIQYETGLLLSTKFLSMIQCCVRLPGPTPLVSSIKSSRIKTTNQSVKSITSINHHINQSQKLLGLERDPAQVIESQTSSPNPSPKTMDLSPSPPPKRTPIRVMTDPRKSRKKESHIFALVVSIDRIPRFWLVEYVENPWFWLVEKKFQIHTVSVWIWNIFTFTVCSSCALCVLSGRVAPQGEENFSYMYEIRIEIESNDWGHESL